MKQIHLLIVEDDEANIKLWGDTINAHNADYPARNKYRITYQNYRSKADTLEAIKYQHFDAAIVDLRLLTDDGQALHNDNGNSVVRELATRKMAVIAVLTGARQEADFQSEYPQVNIFDRADGLNGPMKWLTEKHPIIKSISEAQQHLNDEIVKLFHRSIWPRWQHWTQGSEDLSQSLARHIAAHVHETLLLKGNGKVHNEESYFVPPLKESLATGDLTEYDTDVLIVITPRCDFMQNKSEYVQAAICEKADSRKLTDLRANKIARMHLLPAMVDSSGKAQGPWVVRFDRIQYFPLADAQKRLLSGRFATLTPHFLPSLVERLSNFFGRIGMPGLEG